MAELPVNRNCSFRPRKITRLAPRNRFPSVRNSFRYVQECIDSLNMVTNSSEKQCLTGELFLGLQKTVSQNFCYAGLGVAEFGAKSVTKLLCRGIMQEICYACCRGNLAKICYARCRGISHKFCYACCRGIITEFCYERCLSRKSSQNL